MSGDGYGAPEHKARARVWFESLRDRLCAALEDIENEVQGPAKEIGLAGRFERKPWLRQGVEGDGGVMAVLRGRVFEKAGVNVSTVAGEFSEEFRARIPGAAQDPRFWASGISVVIHPRSPRVPIAHMNTRLIVTGHQPQDTGYFVNGDQHLIVASDHSQGVFLPLSLTERYDMDDLVSKLRKFVSIDLDALAEVAEDD